MSAREDAPAAPGWRRLLWVLPALLALGLIPVWCGRSPAPTVQTVAVKRAPLRVVVATNGKVEPVDDIEVRARLDGRIVAIPDAGKVVGADEELVQFDAGLVAAQLASAESERLAAVESLRAARAQAAEARARFATDTTLFKEGALTRDANTMSERAAIEADAHLAYLERDVPLRVASLESRIKELRSQRDATAVRAPFGGTVYKTQVKKGAMVRLGELLLQIADLEHLRVRANIDQVDLGRVQPGQPVRVSANAYPGRSWSGTMTEIVPNVVVKESRSVAEALARLEPPMDGLVPGMTVDVEIVVAEAADALQVPADAVTTHAGASTVYRLDGKRVRVTPVQLGLTSVTATQITGGLAEGDLVVIGPVEDLRDGMRVEAMPNGAAAG